MSPSYCCAQNHDRTLKDTSEIQWSYLCSSSPVDFGATITRAYGKAWKLSKEWKALIPKSKPKHIHPSKSLTDAIEPAQQCVALTLNDRIEIICYAGNEGQGLSQTKITLHFHSKFPKIIQSTISNILRNKDDLLALAKNNSAQLSFNSLVQSRFLRSRTSSVHGNCNRKEWVTQFPGWHRWSECTEQLNSSELLIWSSRMAGCNLTSSTTTFASSFFMVKQHLSTSPISVWPLHTWIPYSMTPRHTMFTISMKLSSSFACHLIITCVPADVQG